MKDVRDTWFLLRAVAVLDTGWPDDDKDVPSAIIRPMSSSPAFDIISSGSPYYDDGSAFHQKERPARAPLEKSSRSRRLHPRPRSRREGRQDWSTSTVPSSDPFT